MQAPETVLEIMQYEASDDCVAKRATTSEDPSLHGLLQILIPLQPYPRYETPFTIPRNGRRHCGAFQAAKPSGFDSQYEHNSGAGTVALRRLAKRKVISVYPE